MKLTDCSSKKKQTYSRTYYKENIKPKKKYIVPLEKNQWLNQIYRIFLIFKDLYNYKRMQIHMVKPYLYYKYEISNQFSLNFIS